MGQKVNPNALRIGITRNWSGQWYADRKKFAGLLKQDIQIRRYLEPLLKDAGLSRIDIQRTKSLTIVCFVQRPGLVIGQDGAKLTEIKNGLEKLINHKVTKKQLTEKNKDDVDIKISIVEVQNPDFDANLVAQSIASQIEQRASYRMAQKKAIQRVMRAGAQGIKTQTGGRLNGAEISRDEFYKEGALGLMTLNNNIDYALAEAHTIYGKIGVKVWIARPKGFAEDKPSEKAPDRRFGGHGGFGFRRNNGFANGNRPSYNNGQGNGHAAVKPAVVPSAEKKGE